MQLLQQRQHLGDPALPDFCFSLQNWPQIPVASQLPHHWPVHLQHSAMESNSAPPSLVAASRTHSVSLGNTIPSPNWVLGPVLCVRALPHPSALCVWQALTHNSSPFFPSPKGRVRADLGSQRGRRSPQTGNSSGGQEQSRVWWLAVNNASTQTFPTTAHMENCRDLFVSPVQENVPAMFKTRNNYGDAHAPVLLTRKSFAFII